MTVPDFGARYLGLGRDASYQAAERGDFPVLHYGRSIRISTYAGLKHLGWSDDLIARELGIDPETPNDEGSTPSPSESVRPRQKTGDTTDHDTRPAA